MAINARPTQEFVPIKEIRDGVIELKDGGLRAIVLANSINLSLKSGEEQKAIIMQFQNFLNTLDFSVQICIESRRLDIRPYLLLLENRMRIQNEPLMKLQTKEYMEFIRNFTESVNIMTKSFFIVVPYSENTFIPSNNNVLDNLFKKKSNEEKKLAEKMDFEEKRYQLFHIFEDEFLDKNKKEIWFSIIRNKLKLNNKLYARKCIIKEVSAKETNLFLDKNHIQGKCNAKIRLGLYFNNELVSLMTFSKSRYNKNIEYELIRFSSKINTTVIGAGSKLLKYFEKNYKPRNIISYANRRFSQGKIYEKLGFKFIKNTEPNYFYFKPGENKLLSRVQFQKHKLKEKLEVFNSDLTELENMINNGYRVIYDCGNKVYIKEFNE
jgi:hypothetical protein